MSTKGSWQRAFDVEKYNENFDAIFGRKNYGTGTVEVQHGDSVFSSGAELDSIRVVDKEKEIK